MSGEYKLIIANIWLVGMMVMGQLDDIILFMFSTFMAFVWLGIYVYGVNRR